MIQKYFITINPRTVNYNHMKLLNDFRIALIKYYRKLLGKNFNKKKEQQYPIYIFMENGKFKEKYNHLHIIADLPLNEKDNFFNFINEFFMQKYKSADNQIKEIYDFTGILNYLKKEGCEIIANWQLFFKKIDDVMYLP